MAGVDYGLVLFTTDQGIAPASAATIAEKYGFSSFSVPDHTHIPVNREAIHPATGDTSLPDDRYLRTLDPWISLATAAAVTSRIRLSTTVALPVEHDPIALAKSIATLDFLSDGRVRVGAGFGWNTDELRNHGVPPQRRRTVLREYLEAMRALWTAEQACYEGEYVRFGSSWCWPKPVQAHLPVLIGATANQKNFGWIACNADGWITTPRETELANPVAQLNQAWADAGRGGAPEIVALDVDVEPSADKLRQWSELGVTEALYGFPDGTEAEAEAYVSELARNLGAIGAPPSRIPASRKSA
jgi:probable F420-dependent oxidoreductase